MGQPTITIKGGIGTRLTVLLLLLCAGLSVQPSQAQETDIVLSIRYESVLLAPGDEVEIEITVANHGPDFATSVLMGNAEPIEGLSQPHFATCPIGISVPRQPGRGFGIDWHVGQMEPMTSQSCVVRFRVREQNPGVEVMPWIAITQQVDPDPDNSTVTLVFRYAGNGMVRPIPALSHASLLILIIAFAVTAIRRFIVNQE